MRKFRRRKFFLRQNSVNENFGIQIHIFIFQLQYYEKKGHTWCILALLIFCLTYLVFGLVYLVFWVGVLGVFWHTCFLFGVLGILVGVIGVFVIGIFMFICPE